MKHVVVGVDGSEVATAALAWALDLAAQTGASLNVVTAFDVANAWIDADAPDFGRWREMAQRSASTRLDSAVDEAIAGQRAVVELKRTVVEAPAAQALLDESKGADLLVVGSRGLGGFKGLLLGSVSQRCVHHARCPVVVVPSPD